MSLVPIILCGGSGTRMWPLSRSAYPKQYLALHGQQTLVQQTAARLDGLANVAAPIIITNNEQRFLVAEQMLAAGIQPQAMLLEPVGRNTAPAVAVAAWQALQHDANAVLLVLPSDHVIQHSQVFQALVQQALPAAQAGQLVTFGIAPDSPHTGYGYIQRGQALAEVDGLFAVAAFVEKPDLARAQAFVADGGYYWNSGMFLFRADAYLRELQQLQPAIYQYSQQAFEQAQRDLDFVRLDATAFAVCPSDSIDYAVMEKTAKAAVVPAAGLGWSDIGSWSALADITPQDANGNAVQGDVLQHATSGCYVRAESRLVATVGVQDLVVVETADAVLVAHKSQVQDVKKIVEQLAAAGRSEAVFHQRVNRPWGWYEGLAMGERFQVKRIQVKPGSSLSLQLHHHRAEHWVVVKGTALITNGDSELLLSENQSTYIPLGTVHRLVNPGRIPLEIVEVQSGSYLGEDDIVRLEDVYGRAPA